MARRRYDNRRPKFEGEGFVLIDKPLEWTSFDVVNCVRSRFNIPKVGHCGTLDPLATGLLVIVFGKFTKLSQSLSGQSKSYDATIVLGKETDSYDLEGKVLTEKGCEGITEQQIRDAVDNYRGDIEQVPPMVSALKKGGKKLCDLARKGIEVEREARPITVHSLDISEIELPHVSFSTHCSKGTYIRSLAHDIGTDLECGATLTKLVRTQSGAFSLDDAIDIETIKSWEADDFRKHTDALMEKYLEQFTQTGDSDND